MKNRSIPAIATGHALQSLRDSGFDLPAALGEPIDNSIEAGANLIQVRLDEDIDRRGKKHIHRIAFADDGVGMTETVLQHYLQLGYSTRYMSTTTIGKYGVGAKLAALNFGRRIDVWSRRKVNEGWRHVSFDLQAALDAERAGEQVGIDFPDEEPVPAALADLLPKKSGTLVVWSNVDRLEEGRFANDTKSLRVEVEKELSRIFRYFISGGIELRVNGKALLPHDPLLQMEHSWSDSVLKEHLEKEAGAEISATRRKPVRNHFPATEITGKEAISIGGHKAYLTVTLYPNEVLRQRGKGGDVLATKLRVPENEGRISFVRLNREISYTIVPRILPSGIENPDRFIGIEVQFAPELDQFFGVRNVKRGVEPHGELRAAIRTLLARYIPEARKKIEEQWGKIDTEDQEQGQEHTQIVLAVRDINLMLPKGRALPPDTEKERQQVLEDLAKDMGKEDEKSKKDYIEKIKNLPFVVESVDFAGTNFMDIQHLGQQVIIRLNTRHRFYREMWKPIQDISKRSPGEISGEDAVRIARRTTEALTLLLIAYGKAESMHEMPHEQYGDLRGFWGQFLDTLLKKVKNVV